MAKIQVDDKIIDKLKFNSEGLIPAIITDFASKKVLMLGYMNKESLKISLEKKMTCFYSRSRKTLWLKGETSGAFQHIVSISTDCDMDTLLIRVVKDGPACHTGTDSCFDNREIFSFPETAITTQDFSLDLLSETIKDRKVNKKEGSYTTYLFEKGLDKIMKKVGEECTEVIIAAAEHDKKETIYEIADLTYHLLVLMLESGISVDDVKAELASRHVIDKKVKQEKMT